MTTAAPEEAGSLIAAASFDVMIAPRIGTDSCDANDSKVAKDLTSVVAIRSAVTGKVYDFRSINQAASGFVINRFERLLLQVAIENSEFSRRQLNRLQENDAVY